MKLTKQERLVLANQYRILEALFPEETRYYRRSRMILESGYAVFYPDLETNILEEQPETEGREVFEILDMYRMMKSAYDNFSDKSGIDPKEVVFQGFDANSEVRQYCFAEFLVSEDGKWKEFEAVDLNSHWPKLSQYREMLGRWKSLENRRFELTRENVIRIIGR